MQKSMGAWLQAMRTVISPVLCTPDGSMHAASQIDAANEQACSCVTAPLLRASADPNLCFLSPQLYPQFHKRGWDSRHSTPSDPGATAHTITTLGTLVQQPYFYCPLPSNMQPCFTVHIITAHTVIYKNRSRICLQKVYFTFLFFLLDSTHFIGFASFTKHFHSQFPLNTHISSYKYVLKCKVLESSFLTCERICMYKDSSFNRNSFV